MGILRIFTILTILPVLSLAVYVPIEYGRALYEKGQCLFETEYGVQHDVYGMPTEHGEKHFFYGHVHLLDAKNTESLRGKKCSNVQMVKFSRMSPDGEEFLFEDGHHKTSTQIFSYQQVVQIQVSNKKDVAAPPCRVQQDGLDYPIYSCQPYMGHLVCPEKTFFYVRNNAETNELVQLVVQKNEVGKFVEKCGAHFEAVGLSEFVQKQPWFWQRWFARKSKKEDHNQEVKVEKEDKAFIADIQKEEKATKNPAKLTKDVRAQHALVDKVKQVSMGIFRRLVQQLNCIRPTAQNDPAWIKAGYHVQIACGDLKVLMQGITKGRLDNGSITLEDLDKKLGQMIVSLKAQYVSTGGKFNEKDEIHKLEQLKDLFGYIGGQVKAFSGTLLRQVHSSNKNELRHFTGLLIIGMEKIHGNLRKDMEKHHPVHTKVQRRRRRRDFGDLFSDYMNRPSVHVHVHNSNNGSTVLLPFFLLACGLGAILALFVVFEASTMLIVAACVCAGLGFVVGSMAIIMSWVDKAAGRRH